MTTNNPVLVCLIETHVTSDIFLFEVYGLGSNGHGISIESNNLDNTKAYMSESGIEPAPSR